MASRRSREDVIASILECCSTEISMSQLMFMANLSHRLLRSYLGHLVSSGLARIEARDRKKMVSSTALGAVALRCHRNAIALLSGNQGTCPFARDYKHQLNLHELLSHHNSFTGQDPKTIL